MTDTATIVALASGAVPSGVAIVRVSGPAASSVVSALARRVPVPRLAVLRRLRNARDEILDSGLVLWFPGPNSFTGEDVAEFQIHGGRASVEAVISACLEVPHVRLAKPGEFTRRALENGKMDLSAAEGLGDLIEAETEAQRRQALRQMEGDLARQVVGWRETLLDALADAEGDIDFPDEDLPPGLSNRARLRVQALKDVLTAQLLESGKAMRVRDGFRVAILGAPNSGKSSLINYLGKRDVAIVSPIAGTTRDVVELRLILSGLVIWFADTAGIRTTLDEIEIEGISRAKRYADDADLRLGLITNEQERLDLAPLMRETDIWILSKADKVAWPDELKVNEIALSSVTGQGFAELEDQVSSRAVVDLAGFEAAPLTRLRHKVAVTNTISALERALNANNQAPELIAEDLRLATRYLGEIVGKVDMEDVLDRLFSQFCIGK